MSADSRLCALSHFYFNRGAGFKIILIDTETAGSNLYNSIFTIAIKILMQTTLTSIIENAESLCGSCQWLVRIIADGAVAHSGKHHRHGKFKLRFKLANHLTIFIFFDLSRLFAEKNFRLHWFAQRINRRIGYLWCVNQNFIPIHRHRLGVSHWG